MERFLAPFTRQAAPHPKGDTTRHEILVGMSEENIRAARSFFGELNSAMASGGDVVEVLARYCEPGIVSELGAMEGTVSGPEGVARYLEGQLDFIDGMQIDPEEFIEVEGLIVVPFRLHGRARETGLVIEFRYAQLFTMRDGRFARVRMYSTKERALAAARADN